MDRSVSEAQKAGGVEGARLSPPGNDDGDWSSDEAFVRQLRADLRSQAVSRLKNCVSGLSASSLVQDVFVRLLKVKRLHSPRDRGFVYAIAAKSMRHIIVDHARSKRALKRSGRRSHIDLDFVVEAISKNQIDILALNEAIDELATINKRQATVVDMKFFGNCSMPEIADNLGLNISTIESDWSQAREWLYRFMHR